MTSHRTRFWLLRSFQAAMAGALLVAVFWIARPGNVFELLRRTDPRLMAAGLGTALVVVLLRSVRLILIVPPGRLPFGMAVQISAAAQAAASFVPARLGELVLPGLLKRVAGLELASGLGALVVARSLDLAALGAWAAGAIAARWGFGRPLLLLASAALLLPIVLLPFSAAMADRLATRWLATRGVAGRRWTRRIRRIRTALEVLRRAPGRLAAAIAASLTQWAAIWATMAILLAAVGYRWPAGDVLIGAAAGSLATLLPVNLVANVGTLEAGWTAGFAAVGVPVSAAAASGIAVHILSLVLTAVVGSLAAVTLWFGLRSGE